VLTPVAQRIAASGRNFEYPANRDAADPASAPGSDDLRLIRYDFIRYGTAAERTRLLEKWERDVHAAPR
jgi:iron(III) transport system substrate-binding protein